ncbi:hypothetical protein AVEN_2120-1 [Araneus ventricosus]|uniref:Uncharacterized protein n=1 Tax=Araneus ventricosus TaxID=182803 RepID=A0A4Y2ECI8_ARAVE|nr:hypothetical protein AVEN_2120-1 [Araneus ventricosus]
MECLITRLLSPDLSDSDLSSLMLARATEQLSAETKAVSRPVSTHWSLSSSEKRIGKPSLDMKKPGITIELFKEHVCCGRRRRGRCKGGWLNGKPVFHSGAWLPGESLVSSSLLHKYAMDHSSRPPLSLSPPWRGFFYQDCVTDHKVVLFKSENPFSCLSVIELSFFFPIFHPFLSPSYTPSSTLPPVNFLLSFVCKGEW